MTLKATSLLLLHLIPHKLHTTVINTPAIVIIQTDLDCTTFLTWIRIKNFLIYLFNLVISDKNIENFTGPRHFLFLHVIITRKPLLFLQPDYPLSSS